MISNGINHTIISIFPQVCLSKLQTWNKNLIDKEISSLLIKLNFLTMW